MPTQNIKALAPKITTNASADTRKEKESIKKAELEYEVRSFFHVGSEFRLEMDCRASVISGHARFKPGDYKILYFYPYYILTERIDLEAKAKSDQLKKLNKEELNLVLDSTPIVYKSKESFTYSDMYQIMKNTFPGLYARIDKKEDE